MTTILGLTGGIATGKSTVSNFLRDKQIPIIDADMIARQVVEPGSSGLDQIVQGFGVQFLNADNSLNRKKLGELVFSKHDQLKKLNKIMQPLIAREIEKQFAGYKQTGHLLVVLDAPLLFEQHYENMVDLVMVVVTTPSIQLQRLMERDQLSQTSAEKRIDAQWPLTEKQKRADVVIDNSHSIKETEKQVLNWLEANHLI
ncbi:dephospho-CoA kinase [Paucilactobacillus kaifaensis]|uniref:dephospho-CoA kinase n=1 Tax=Paucilactobacillus kaifaensis TaxID=2559921 RepID=UPI0010F98AE2|nr:dephospho-CoA kinase [Paucilactobacillus kaifaensis]